MTPYWSAPDGRDVGRPAAFIGLADGVPGPAPAAARWLAERGRAWSGGETIAFEHLAAGRGHATLPVHRILLVESGINIVETMRLAGCSDSGARRVPVVLNPLPIVGATGAPVRPLAVLAVTAARHWPTHARSGRMAHVRRGCRSRWIAATGVPSDVARRRDGRVLDALGNCLAAHADRGRRAPRCCAPCGGRAAGESTVVGTGDRCPPPPPALVNGTLAHALDFDDTHLPSVLHPRASVVPAALAVAEARERPAPSGWPAVAAGDRDHQPARHGLLRPGTAQLAVLREGPARHVDLRHARRGRRGRRCCTAWTPTGIAPCHRDRRAAWAPASSRPTAPAARSSGSTAAGRPTRA